MKKMHTLCASLLCACLGTTSCAGDYDRILAGKWIGTAQNREGKHVMLEFTGNHTVTISNYLENPVTVQYAIPDNPYMRSPEKGGFSIEYRHDYETLSSGVKINTYFSQELYYHEENGIPILSETGFEHDGCGFMIVSEFLPEDRFTEGFESALYKKHLCKDLGKARGR